MHVKIRPDIHPLRTVPGGFCTLAIFSTLCALWCPDTAISQESPESVRVRVKATFCALLEDEDTDHDRKITIDDPHVTGTARGDKRFWCTTLKGKRFEVAGSYHLSNLLQELRLAEEEGLETTTLDPHRIFEPPAVRISRMIREHYWDGLTRRIDSTDLQRILSDEKTVTSDGYRYIYVPASDTPAFDYFTAYTQRRPESKARVVRLPDRVTGEYVRNLDGRHGVLALALRRSSDGGQQGVPFVVPGGRFNEMYGWDSYFITLGLLKDGRVGSARAMVDNFVYEIARYGKILNANRTYYLTRSQPPFFTSMVRAVLQALPKSDSTKVWLRGALAAAIDEYTRVWMSGDHRTPIGLNRYFDTGHGPPPEVEPGHFDAIYAPFAKKSGMNVRAFEQAYRAGTVSVPALDSFFVHDRAMRESGHDTSYRLLGICADLATVDLNSLLYRTEVDIGDMIKTEFADSLRLPDGTAGSSAVWYSRAGRRKELINKYCWNDGRGMFFDYDARRGEQQSYVSATTFYPLWAGLASDRQAASLVANALPLLESAGGITGSSEDARGAITPERPERQWDYPNGWAPHQMLAWQGFLNYKRNDIAQRLAYRWLYTITSNAVDYNGTIPEKFDLARRTHRVFAEYGNVGTTFSYITREGFGWTNASYQVGLGLLTPRMRESLNTLIPPEWIFPER